MSHSRRSLFSFGFIFRVLAISAFGVFLLLCFAITALYMAPGVKGSTSSTLSSGRVVAADTDGLFIAAGFENDVVTVHTGIGTVTVLPTHVTIDNRPVCDVPTGAQKVSVHRKSGRIRIAADGQELYASEKLWW